MAERFDDADVLLDDLTDEQEELVRRLAELRGEEVAEPSESLLGRIRTAFR